MVAPSYKSLQQIGDPFKENGKSYVKVLGKNGKERKVRWYSEAEYAKAFPTAGEKSITTINTPIQETPTYMKDALGFTDGFIYIVAGDTSPYEEWFNAAATRYARPFGWYIPSGIEFDLNTLPYGTEAKLLRWEQITDTKGNLYAESALKSIVEELVLPPAIGSFVGSVGDRLLLDVVVEKVIALPANQWGSNSFHIFKDKDGNIYTWNTGSKTLEEGRAYKLRGTVKAHERYENTNQTALTRCTIVN